MILNSSVDHDENSEYMEKQKVVERHGFPRWVNPILPGGQQDRRSGILARHGQFIKRRCVFNGPMSGKVARPTNGGI
jgi:hypothetical protein